MTHNPLTNYSGFSNTYDLESSVMNVCGSYPKNLKVGTVLCKGEYNINEIIGHGGFGRIYRAQRTCDGKTVALKELFIDSCCIRGAEGQVCTLNTAEARAKFSYARNSFINEYVNIKNCVNSSIIKAYGCFMENDTIYYVMEYIDGITLNQKLRKSGILSVSKAVDYIIDIARGIEYMHRCGMVHLDIKPSNIMVRKSDRPVLIDFGSSRMASCKDDSYDCPLILSRGYYSEEMFNKSFNDSDYYYRMDVYALGTTLYQLITDHLPNSYDCKYSYLPKELDMIISKSLDASGKGYMSVSEFVNDLECFKRTLGVDLHSYEVYRKCA